MTHFDPQHHHRHSIRLPGYDYTQPGAYFVTLVTHGRECLFGEVEGGQVRLSEFGFLVENEWRRLEQRFGRLVSDAFVIMPNHVHGILWMIKKTDVGAGQKESVLSEGSSLAPPLRVGEHVSSIPQTPSGSLGAIIRAYKSTTARLVNGLRRTPGALVWQRNYYERIIRCQKDLDAIRRYILNNPLQWEMDGENPWRNEAAQ